MYNIALIQPTLFNWVCQKQGGKLVPSRTRKMRVLLGKMFINYRYWLRRSPMSHKLLREMQGDPSWSGPQSSINLWWLKGSTMKQFNRCKGISTPCFYKFQVPSKNCMFRLFCFNSGKFPLTFTFNSASFAISSRISHHVPIIFHQCPIIIHDSFRYI